MALWNKVKQELDRAGQVAHDALDQGKVRLEGFRARQLADKSAQALGYALYRARQQGRDLDADSYARLSSTLAAHEAEAAQHEQRLSELAHARKAQPSADGPTSQPEEDRPPPAA